LAPAGRYSEDIDLVQVRAGAIGDVINALRVRLDPWLGAPQRKQGHGRVTLVYRFTSEIPPTVPLRLKVEINTREHFNVYGLCTHPFSIDSPWYNAAVQISTYILEELLGTKLRALYQRKKGRDLYDLWLALSRYPSLDVTKILTSFRRYMEHGGHGVSQTEYVYNLDAKLADPTFRNDIIPLLANNTAYYTDEAHSMILNRLLEKL